MPSYCKRALFLFAFHIIIAYCLHIADACISRVHACIVFALRGSGFESPCGGSDNAFALVVSVMQVLTLRINWIYRPDVYNSPHALIILYHMQGYYLLTCYAITSPHELLLITCTNINSSHILLLLHHMQCCYLANCTALTSSYACLQYDSAEWEPAFLRQASEFPFFPLLPREASK